jgi:hypothetical protein
MHKDEVQPFTKKYFFRICLSSIALPVMAAMVSFACLSAFDFLSLAPGNWLFS